MKRSRTHGIEWKQGYQIRRNVWVDSWAPTTWISGKKRRLPSGATRRERRDRSGDMQKSLTRRDRPGITDTVIKIERTRRALRPPFRPRAGPILSPPFSSPDGSRHDPTIAKGEVLLRVTSEMTDITLALPRLPFQSSLTYRLYCVSKSTEIEAAATRPNRRDHQPDLYNRYGADRTYSICRVAFRWKSECCFKGFVSYNFFLLIT